MVQRIMVFMVVIIWHRLKSHNLVGVVGQGSFLYKMCSEHFLSADNIISMTLLDEM